MSALLWGKSFALSPGVRGWSHHSQPQRSTIRSRPSILWHLASSQGTSAFSHFDFFKISFIVIGVHSSGVLSSRYALSVHIWSNKRHILGKSTQGTLLAILDLCIEVLIIYLQWSVDISKGLQTLHSCTPAVLHRDLKTLNLLVKKFFFKLYPRPG